MSRISPTRLRRSNRDREMITPEGIALPITVASKGARIGALMIDFALIGALMIATTVLLIYIGSGTFDGFDAIGGSVANKKSAIASALEFLFVVWLIAMFLFRNAYFLFFELGPRGATPGKRVTGIRIAARDGGRLGVDTVIARNLLRDIELFLPLTFVSAMGSDGGAGTAAAVWFLIFALFPFFNRDRLRAGDVVAGSWVVEVPKRKLEAAMTAARAPTDAAPPADTPVYRFGEPELAVYGEYELQTLERVLREDSAKSLAAVHESIAAKIGREDGAGDEKAFLEAYYAQLRARLEANMRMGQRKADKHDESGAL